jgi:cytosine deaminase
VTVAMGGDCVMDPWYGMGSADMLEVAHMGLHVAQMTSQTGIGQCFDAVTVNAAKVMHLEGYGIEAGCDASFVLLQAKSPMDAIRLRANRLKVWRKGKLLAETAEAVTRMSVPGRPDGIAFGEPRAVAKR